MKQRLFCVAVVILSALALPGWAAASAEFMPCDTNFFQLSICQGQSVFIAGNIYDAQNPNGVTLLPGASWDGTDSVVIVNLTILSPAVNLITATYCKNEALFINGNIYDVSNPIGTEYLPGAAYTGCDSVISINLSFLSEANQHLQQTICTGDTVWVNNQAYDQYYYLGMETIAGGAINGCDSIILVDLTVLPTPIDTLQASLCPYETLRINGTVYGINRPSGMELLPNAAENGCDSLIYIQLTFTQPPSNTAFLGADQLIFSGDTVCLSIPLGLDFSDISWQPVLPCITPDCSNVCFSATQNETIIATISDQNQCLFFDTINISVFKERPIFVPNVFAPEADAPNNRFAIFPGIVVTRINWLTVYDRWGSLVYEARDFQASDEGKAWDGTVSGNKAAVGVYAYAFEVTYPDGSLEQRSGMVTLVR